MNELDYRDRIIREGIAVLKNQRSMLDCLKKEIDSVDLQFDGTTLNGLSTSSTPGLAKRYEVAALKDTKLYQKIRDMVAPYNSFLGISNDLKCLSNKKDCLQFDQILYYPVT